MYIYTYHKYMPISLDCPGLGLMVYQCFHSQIDAYIASHYQETVGLLLKEGQKKIEAVSKREPSLIQ